MDKPSLESEVPQSIQDKPELLLDIKYRNLRATESKINKIPHILHHIWLTSDKDPRQIRDEDLENAVRTHKMMKNSEHEWTHIIWVNDKALLKKSIDSLAKLKKTIHIEIRQISEVSEYLSNYEIFTQQLSNKRWGVATDILRYDLVNHFGGVYADINYVFSRIPDHESTTYDFFGVTFSFGYLFTLGNFMFGAKPHHPVIQQTQELVAQNFNDPPIYIQEALQSLSLKDLTYQLTAAPLSFAYFTASHQEGNIDVVYPIPKGLCVLAKRESFFSRDFKEQVDLSFYQHALYQSKTQEEKDRYTSETLAKEICADNKQIVGYDGTNGAESWL